MQIRPTQPERDSIDARLGMLSGGETIRGPPLGGLPHAARVHLTDDAFEELCKQNGFESSRFSPLLKYKLAQFLALERDTAQAMSRSGVSFEKAVHRIGGAAIDVFFESVAGRTMRILAEGEPHRLLGAVANGYGLLVNFGNRTYRRTGERSCDFVFQKEYLGAVHTAGIFESSFDRVYGLPLRIDLQATSVADFTFKLSW